VTGCSPVLRNLSQQMGSVVDTVKAAAELPHSIAEKQKGRPG
jgi:hypothetical protein